MEYLRIALMTSFISICNIQAMDSNSRRNDQSSILILEEVIEPHNNLKMTFDPSMHSNQRHEFMMTYFARKVDARKPTNIDEFNILKNRLNTWVEELTVKAQSIKQRVQSDFDSVKNLDQRSDKYRLYRDRIYDVKYVLDGYLQKDVNDELQAFYNTQLDQDLINKYKYLTDITFPLYKYWK